MGQFKKFVHKPKKPEINYKPLTDAEAWIGILYACIAADGIVNDAEIDSLSRMITCKEKFSGIEIEPLYTTVGRAKKDIGAIGLIEACCELIDENEKDTLFLMAVEIVLADGTLDEDEEKVIKIIAHKMKINSELVKKIVEVMLIRNRGNVVLSD